MTLFEAVYSHVMGDSIIGSSGNSLKLTQLSPTYTPAESRYPWAVVRRVSSGTRPITHDGDQGLSLIRLEFTVWDDQIKRSEKIMSRLQAIFKGVIGTFGGNGGIKFSVGAFSGPRTVFHPDTQSPGLQLDVLGLLDEDSIS